MFSEKNIHPRSRVWGFGVLILLVLMGSMAGCSSSPTEKDTLSSSVEGEGSAKDKMASLESSSQSPGALKAIPVATYSSADRAVVLRYAEKGETDSANLSKALKLVQRAEKLSHAERTMEDYLVLAAHYRLKGEMQKVVQHANQGIMSKSDSKRVKALMFIYLGYTYEDKSKAMARSYFTQAAQIDPGLYKGHYESGRIYYLERKFSEALPPLEEAYNLNPESADIYGMLGQMFYGMDQYETAAETLKKALAMSPETHWIYLKLGDTYFYGLKNREEGGRYYQQAVSKIGSDPDTHFGVALYYRYKNEYLRAEEHLNKAMTLDEGNPKYKRELDDMLSEKDEMAKGIRRHKQAIMNKPEDPQAVSKLGRFYLRWGKYDKAEVQYKKAVEFATKLDKASAAKPNPGKPAKPGVKGSSKVAEHANNLGWFYYNDKKYAQAEEAFKMVLKVNPKYAPAQFGLGRAYESQKQYELAVTHYAKAVDLDPDSQEAQEHLSRLKQSGKLKPVGEMVKTQEEETGKKPVVEVKK